MARAFSDVSIIQAHTSGFVHPDQDESLFLEINNKCDKRSYSPVKKRAIVNRNYELHYIGQQATSRPGATKIISDEPNLYIAYKNYALDRIIAHNVKPEENQDIESAIDTSSSSPSGAYEATMLYELRTMLPGRQISF